MQRLFVHLVVSVVTFIIGIAAATPWASFRAATDGQDRQEILKVEQQYLTAHVNRDRDALAQILSDDFAFTNNWGGVADKDARLALLENPYFSFQSIDTRNVSVTVEGDTAYVEGQATVRGISFGRDFVTAPYNFTRRYEKRDGHWQIVSVKISKFYLRQ